MLFDVYKNIHRTMKNQHNMIVCSCVLGSIMSLIMSLSFIRCISLKRFNTENIIVTMCFMTILSLNKETCITPVSKHSPLDHFQNRATSGGAAAAGLTKQAWQPLLVTWYMFIILEHISLRKTPCIYHHATPHVGKKSLAMQTQTTLDNPTLDNWIHFFCRITDAASSVAHTPGQRLLQQLSQTQSKQKKKTCQNTKTKALKLS